MLRKLVGSALALVLCAGALPAEEKAKKDTARKDAAATEARASRDREGTITKVDVKKQSITVKMDDKSGKGAEKTMTLAPDVRVLDSHGKPTPLTKFKAGTHVLITERHGLVAQVKQTAGGHTEKSQTGTEASRTNTGKKPGDK